jgi:hypothetical protein
MKYLKSSVLFLIALLLLTGCGKNEIQGTVTDPFGNGIEGVTVSIERSDLHSSTGKNGHYSIPAILGTFTVKYSKPGYATQKITLISRRNTPFPLQTVIIYPIPKEPGLYYVGKKSLIKMSPGKIEMTETRRKTGDAMRDLQQFSQIKFCPDKIMAAAIRPGDAQFIDNSHLRLIPMRLRSDGCFLHFVIFPSLSAVKVGYDRMVREEKSKKGEQKLIVRTIHCEPGDYAWVEFHRDMFGSDLPKPHGTCYAFKVKSPNTAQSH